MTRMALLALLACGLGLGTAVAQELPPPLPPDDVTQTVRPPADLEQTVQPPADFDPAPAFDPFDRPFSYPSLSQQTFDGLNGLLRSEQSVFGAPELVTIVDRQQLAERQATDMFQALQNEVGIMMQRTARGQASPYVRGLTGQQVLILVDGIRLNNSTFRAGANQYFNTIDPGQVERIEVLRGPGSVLYGSDAIGGAINVVTRSADLARGACCDYRGGQFIEYFSTADTASYTRLNGEGFSGPVGVFAGASYMNVNDLRTGGDLGVQPFTNYRQYAGDVKVNTLLDQDNILTFAAQHFEQEMVPRSDRFLPFVNGPPANTPRPTWFDPQQRDLMYLRLQGIDPSGPIDAYTATVSYARQKEGSLEIRNLSVPSTDVRQGEFDVQTVGASLVLASDLGWAGKLTYGGDYYHDDVDARRFRINSAAGTVAPDTPQFPDDSFYERAGLFLNWNVQATERLAVTSGVRYENIDLGSTPIIPIDPPGPGPAVPTPVHITPSFQDWVFDVGLAYSLTPCINLVGGVSEGFRAPNLDDLVATNPFVQQNAGDQPSVTLEAEHALTYEVGMKFDTRRIHSQVMVFWTDLEDNIQRTQVLAGAFQRANQDSALQGVEWQGELLLEDGWSTYGNFFYTYGYNKVTGGFLSRVPPLQGIVGLRWRDECRRHWFDIYTWLVDRQDKLHFQDTTDSRIPPLGTPGYGTLNVRLGTTLADAHRLSLTLENILDKGYRVHGSGVDGPGFNAVLGYDVTF